MTILAECNLDQFESLLEKLVALTGELLHVGEVELGVGITARTHILFNTLSLDLEDAHTPSMEPVGAALTADVKLRIIIRLATQAVDLFIVLGCLALITNVISHFLGHLGCNTNARPVKPI